MACETFIKRGDNYHMGEGQQSWHVLVPLLVDLNYITQHVKSHKLHRCERNAETGIINLLSTFHKHEYEACDGTSSGQSSILQLL